MNTDLSPCRRGHPLSGHDCERNAYGRTSNAICGQTAVSSHTTTRSPDGNPSRPPKRKAARRYAYNLSVRSSRFRDEEVDPILVPTDFDVLGVGLNATDTLILLDEFPPYAGKVPFAEERLSPGGQVATAIVACANWGLRARYIGTVGDDLRGDIQRASLSGTGVDISSMVVRPGCENQTAYILIDRRTGERTVLWRRPPGLSLTPADMRESDIASCRMLHIDGFDTEAAEWAARVARRFEIPVSIDVDTVYPGFEQVLKNVDYLVAGSSGRKCGREIRIPSNLCASFIPNMDSVWPR